MKSYRSKTDKFNYLGGFANFVVVALIVWLLYRLFLHPEPIIKTVATFNGLSLEFVFFSSVVMIAYTIGFYPAAIEKMNSVFRGVLLLFVSILFAAFIYFILFRSIIGKLAVAYFNPNSILASGGTGAEPLNALMQSSDAIFYFHIGFIWMAFLWKLSAGNWPWNDCTHSVVAFSRSITILFVATILYTILFHPVICYLFYPPQNKAAVEPWWGNIASTGSGLFHLGWILCTLAWIIISMFLWEGYPWKLINRDKKGSIARVGATDL
jgi:AAT family amino acid transporter